MAVTLRYFTEFGKPALQKTICGGIYARDYCILSECTMSSHRKFTFAISSPDEFLVVIGLQCNVRFWSTTVLQGILATRVNEGRMISLLQIYCWVSWHKNFEDRLGFGKVMPKNKVALFFRTRCIIRDREPLKFLANVNSRSRLLYVIVRPSVCRLSVCRL